MIRHGELPEPVPGPTDVLVDVDVSTVNQVDTFVRSGAWHTPTPFPFVIGRDLVGTVVAAGPGAPGFAAGDRVWCNSLGHAGRQGAAAERAVVPADRLYPLPPGVDPAAAVAVVHPAATAYLALFTHGRLRAGETVLVLGGAGNIGRAAVVLAAGAGARVLATASADDLDRMRELGAAEAFDYRAPDLAERIRRVAPDGVDLHVDTPGRNDLADTLPLLAQRGRAVLLAGMRTRPELPAADLYLGTRSLLGFVISGATGAELAEAAGAVNRLLAADALWPGALVPMPLSAAGEAHRRLETGGVRGRIILQVR